MHIDIKQKPQVSQRQRNCLLHQCCFWAYHTIILAISCVLIGKISIAYNIGQDVMKSSQLAHSIETVNLWKKGIILLLTLFVSRLLNTNNCPEGYQPLLDYTWTGTAEGCFCTTGLSGFTVQYILTGVCTKQLVAQGCTQIAALPPQELQMWKGAHLICLKRSDSLNFYESVKTKTEDGQNMKICSFNKTYQVHTLQNITCPISQASNTSLTASATVLMLDTTNNQKLYYLSQNGYPIADFKVTQHAFCEYLNDQNISPNKVGNYKLEITKYKTCETLDTRYKQFDKMNEEQFFTNNTRIYNKLSALPGYPRPSTNYIFKLGYIKYPQWSYNCRISPSHNLNQATQHLLFNKQNYILKVLLDVCIPCLVVIGFLLRIFFIVRHIIQIRQKMMYGAVFLKDQEIIEQLPNLNLTRNKTKQIGLFIFEQMLTCAVFIIVIFSILMIMDTSVWTKQVFRSGCTETYINNIFRYYEQQTDKINQILVQICFIWVVLQVIDVIYLVIRLVYLDLSSKVQIIQQQAISNSQQLDPIKAQSKQFEIAQNNNRPQESSDIMLEKLEKNNKELKGIRDLDDIMGEEGIFGAGETKQNFYGELENSDYNLVAKKKKKKTVGNKKKKNLFKQ